MIFNHQNPKFQNCDVRWALALALDIKAISMAGYRGAATISAIAVPPTGTHPDFYHKPMEEWLSSFEVDTGKKVIKPYDATIGQQIADMLRPSMGDQIPTDPEKIGEAFWGSDGGSQDTEAAAQLLERAGFTRQGNDWYMPDGQRFSIKVVVEGEARPVMTRSGSMIAEKWRRFGIDATTELAQAAFITRRNGGDYEVIISWSVETWGGHPDLSFFLDSWHSQFVQPAGAVQTPRTGRVVEPQASPTRSSRYFVLVAFYDPKGIDSAKSSSSWRYRKCRSSRSCRTTSSRWWTRPTGRDTRRRRTPTPIRSRTGATRAT